VSSESGRQSTATIKFGKGFEAPWLVVAGTPAEIRAQLNDAFGLDPAKTAGLTLDQLISVASKQAQESVGVATAHRDLGASVIETTSTPAPAEGDPWDAAEKAKLAAGQETGAGEAAPAQPQTLLEKVQTAESVRKLQELWRDNKAEWDTVADAAKARKVELSEAVAA
jgi:hypothetical protein